MTANIDTHVEMVLVQNTVVHVNSGNENDSPKRVQFLNFCVCQNGTCIYAPVIVFKDKL